MVRSKSPSNKDDGDFKFVAESNERVLRSHAMRAHWRQRKRRTSGPKNPENGMQRPLRPLLPHRQTHQGSAPSTHRAESALDAESNVSSSSRQHHATNELSDTPSQVLYETMRDLGCGVLDPFDSLPITLTPEHNRLLHHWLTTCTTTTFSDLSPSALGLARDVWLPLHLSNSAAFSACMAHSAAHLARMQGKLYSREALEFKMEAMQIVSEWIDDQTKALSDDMFSAVLGLLTYERYWGTETEWKVHHDGLLRMIGLRGGVGKLAGNWRLALVTFLATLMVRPSWLDSSNRILELVAPFQSHYGLHLIVGDDVPPLQRVRSLWLLSLVQDTEQFALDSIVVSHQDLSGYTNLQDALILLRIEMEQYDQDARRGAVMDDAEYTRLACVFFIAILCRGSKTTPSDPTTSCQPSTPTSYRSAIASLDMHLMEYRDTWCWDVDGLYTTIYSGFFTVDYGIPNRDYVLSMLSVFRSTCSAVRQRMEWCLLQALCQFQFPTTWNESSFGGLDSDVSVSREQDDQDDDKTEDTGGSVLSQTT